MLEKAHFVLPFKASLDVGGRLSGVAARSDRMDCGAYRQLNPRAGSYPGLLFFRGAILALFPVCFPFALRSSPVALTHYAANC